MNSYHSKLIKLSKIMLATTACAVIALTFVSPAYTSGGGSQNLSREGDHGDNPVIGSLPIKFVEELNHLFPAPQSRVKFLYMSPLPVFALCSASKLTDDIVTAAGEPFGGVNSRDENSILGLCRDGLVVVYRSRLEEGKLRLGQWVTDEYIGGTATITTNSGTFTLPITQNLIELPARKIINQPALIIYALIEIEPNPNSQAASLKITVTSTGRFATIDYSVE
ncbi:MAG: hypothetical protein OSB63_05630 [Planctomycetota bacterium]|nr:hypothetical protein [Planctomycetota bacterium]